MHHDGTQHVFIYKEHCMYDFGGKLVIDVINNYKIEIQKEIDQWNELLDIMENTNGKTNH